MQLRRPFWLRLACLLLLLLPAPSLRAGGGPFNTLIVVNTNSADSVELGDYYATVHNIPSHHICRVGITNPVTITSNQFHDLLLTPILNHISAENLSNQINCLVLCGSFPTRVGGPPHTEAAEGVTASLFYGFKNAPGFWDSPGYGTCKLPLFTSNEYFKEERSFQSSDAWNNTNGFVAFHLIASNLPMAKLVADRGKASISTFPPAATFYLAMLGDQYRGIREQQFANAQFSFSTLPNLTAACTLVPLYEIVSGQTNLMGYHDGFANVYNTNLVAFRTNNIWLPGAFADHLTSFGGMIPDPFFGQSTILDWMSLGATASYGTVAEPCAYPSKFPDPLMAFYYARGFTLGESYAMSVEAPYQGLFAGDPLACPFAASPLLNVSSQTPFQIITGTIPMQVSASARSNGTPAASLDGYLDGRFQAHLASILPSPGNQLFIAVAGITNSAIVTSNDSLFDAVATLANAINANTNSIVRASARGDRIELIHKSFNHAGDNVPVTAEVLQGTAPSLTLGVGPSSPQLVPSPYPARTLLYIEDNPWNAGATLGDTLTCVITLTNGIAVTNTIVASQGEARRSVLERLMSSINTNPVLMATNGVRYDRLALNFGEVFDMGGLFARTPGPDGAGILIDYSVSPVSTNGLTTNVNFSSFMRDFPDDIRPRASVLFHVRPTNDILASTFPFSTTNLPDGIHTLDFIAQDGSAVAAQSRLSLPLVICNSSPQAAAYGTNGEAIANGDPPSLTTGTDFGSIPWGQARTNVFSLLNNGSVALSITHWTTNGPGADAFQISGIPSTIEAGGISNFTVVFAPASATSCTATLSVESDAILPLTNFLLAGTAFFELSVFSEHGTSNPSSGLHTNLSGTLFTNSVSAPPPVNGTQLVCTGWSMTGHDPASGSTNQFTMTLTNHATLVWLWNTNYWLETPAAANGSISPLSSWQPANLAIELIATPDSFYHFLHWSGSVSSTSTPLQLLMDTPKSMQALFAENLAAHDIPEWWLAQHGWTNDFDAAALTDAEPDGFFTWQEYIADTDPADSNSFPRMESISTEGAEPVLVWPASTGRLYQIHRAEDLVAGPWITQQLSLGTGQWTDTNPPPASNRYYRIAPLLP